MAQCDKQAGVVKPGLGYVDTIITKLVLPTLPAWHAISVTPNALTTLGLLASATCVYSLYQRRYLALTLVMLALRCYFDYADGLLARRYGQVTAIGDWYDHSVDILFALGVFAVLAFSRYSGKLKCTLLGVVAVFSALFLVQMGCIELRFRERQQTKDGISEPKETSISRLRHICPSSATWLVNFFDNGTLYIVFAVLMGVFHVYA